MRSASLSAIAIPKERHCVAQVVEAEGRTEVIQKSLLRAFEQLLAQ